MPSPPSLQPGVFYHIYNRGNNRENIFIEERNYHYFLQLYAHHCEPVAETYAYCLLRNHFHLLARMKELGDPKAPVKESSWSMAFSDFFNAYAKAINKAYGRTGSLFQHPFGRIPVLTQSYVVQLVLYIHHNPQKHGLVVDFRDWPYSSYRALLSRQATHLQREHVLTWFDGQQGFAAAHRAPIDEAALVALTPEDLD